MHPHPKIAEVKWLGRETEEWFDLSSYLRDMVKFVAKRTPCTVRHFIEDLGNGIGLDMVLIPGGTFLMGSPEKELHRDPSEGPQHEVTVPSFCMGRYPVTQAQWRQVAKHFPKQNESLEQSPSKFKGDDRPVESVSWYEAVEFCQRLSTKVGRDYRLPSEAEWEYACRAKTNTPFHFGETISTEIANYDGNSSYGEGNITGVRLGETTPINHFNCPNEFGLVDMHGNVWEWCQDHWHENYKGAPTDASAWVTGGDSTYRILRGGSWNSNPRYCRSAYRGWDGPRERDHSGFGFRLVLSLPRAPFPLPS